MIKTDRYWMPSLRLVLLALACMVVGSIFTGRGLPMTGQVGPVMDSSHAFHSIIYDRASASWFAGAYTQAGDVEGPALVARSADGLAWDSRFATSDGPVESISGFVAQDGLVWALSEASTSPALYAVPSSGGPLEPIWAAERLDMYLLGGPSAQAAGIACVGSNRDVGGYLVDMAGNVLTPELRDLDGHPLFAWDAMEWKGAWVAGTSRGIGEYHGDWAGKLAVLKDGAWEITPYAGAGIVQVTTLESDPSALYLCTTYGEIQRTTDLRHFTKYFQAEPGSDVRLWEVEGKVVEVSAAGVVYENGKEVWRTEADFLSLAPGPDGVLAGIVNKDGAAYGVRVTW